MSESINNLFKRFLIQPIQMNTGSFRNKHDCLYKWLNDSFRNETLLLLLGDYFCFTWRSKNSKYSDCKLLNNLLFIRRCVTLFRHLRVICSWIELHFVVFLLSASHEDFLGKCFLPLFRVLLHHIQSSLLQTHIHNPGKICFISPWRWRLSRGRVLHHFKAE